MNHGEESGMPQRLTKLDAAATLGVSPSTIDRMIQREELTIEKETRGSRYKVWVLLDDEAGPSPEPSSDGSLESSGDASSDLSEPSSGGSIDESFWGELITLRERVKGLEELSDYHKQQLKDAEWRYQQLLQQLEVSQRTVEILGRALPAPADEAGRRRRWWPFRRDLG